MDNYTALLLLIVPGFISRKIYGVLSNQKPAKNNFEETIYSLIFSVYNLLMLYVLAIIVFWCKGSLYLLETENIISIFKDGKAIAFYITLNLIISFLTALVWSKIQIYYIKLLSRLKHGKSGNEIIPSESVFKDVFNDTEIHWVEIYKEDKLLVRGILSRKNLEEGEFYVEDAEPEIKFFLDENKKIIGYKGHYADIKNNIIIKEIDITKHN